MVTVERSGFYFVCGGSKSRRMGWAGNVALMDEDREVYRVLLGETGGKETTGLT